MGSEAVTFYREHWQETDLVIFDMVMPEMDGRELFKRLQQINPSIIALLSSGYSLDSQAQAILDDGVKGFLQKPFRKTELAKIIIDTLRGE